MRIFPIRSFALALLTTGLLVVNAACAPAPVAMPTSSPVAIPQATASITPTATTVPTDAPLPTSTRSAPTNTPTLTNTPPPSPTATRVATATPTLVKDLLGTGPESNNIFKAAGGLAADEAYKAEITTTSDAGQEITIVVGVKVESAYKDSSTGHTIGQFVFVGKDGVVYRFKCDTFAMGNDRGEKSIFVGNVPPSNPGFVTLENIPPNTFLRMGFTRDNFQQIINHGGGVVRLYKNAIVLNGSIALPQDKVKLSNQ